MQKNQPKNIFLKKSQNVGGYPGVSDFHLFHYVLYKYLNSGKLKTIRKSMKK